MHKDILPLMEPMYIIPGKQLILRQYMMVTDYLFALFAFFFIYIVGNQHVQHFFTAGKLCQLI